MNTQVHCKPGLQQEELFAFLKTQTGFCFTKTIHSSGFPVSLRSLDPAIDLPLIHDWVNRSYAQQFWQLAVDLPELRTLYDSVMNNETTHSIVAVYREQLVAQIDLYHAQEDEVGKCFDVTRFDYGVHFLMAPLHEPVRSLSTMIFSTVLEWLFQFRCVQRVVGEPDHRNAKANALVQRIGFRFQKRITLQDKEANLYFCDRSGFIPSH